MAVGVGTALRPGMIGSIHLRRHVTHVSIDLIGQDIIQNKGCKRTSVTSPLTTRSTWYFGDKHGDLSSFKTPSTVNLAYGVSRSLMFKSAMYGMAGLVVKTMEITAKPRLG